jgi:hypothetical protein
VCVLFIETEVLPPSHEDCLIFVKNLDVSRYYIPYRYIQILTNLIKPSWNGGNSIFLVSCDVYYIAQIIGKKLRLKIQNGLTYINEESTSDVIGRGRIFFHYYIRSTML